MRTIYGTYLSTFQHSTRVAGLQFGGIHWDHCRQDLHPTKWHPLQSKAFKVAYKSGNVTPFRPFFLLSKGRISHIKEIWWLEPCTSPERTDFCPQKEAQLIPVQLQLHPKFSSHQLSSHGKCSGVFRNLSEHHIFQAPRHSRMSFS